MREFHTIILDRIPVMNFDMRNAAKRFITLIDTLYDANVKLIASAAAEPDALYRADEGFEAQRVQAHRLASDRDAIASLSGAAARRRAGGCFRPPSPASSKPDGQSAAGIERIVCGRLERVCRKV